MYDVLKGGVIMLTVKNQNIEDEYQALIVQCTTHQLKGTCDKECLKCDLGGKLRYGAKEVNDNVQEQL